MLEIRNKIFFKKWSLRWYLNLLLLSTFLKKQNGISKRQVNLESKGSKNKLVTARVHDYFSKNGDLYFRNTQRVI